MSKLPVIFLAFANEQEKKTRYLRSLAIEQRALKEALDRADKKICEVVVEANATLDTIINTFQKEHYRDRIAVFHYGGHADGYQLLLESANNKSVVAHGAGLVSFLSGQEGLRFIFLNGCSTQQQAIDLIEAGIPAVIGTSNAIADTVATQLSTRFYRSIGEGNSLDRSWKEAKDAIFIQEGGNTRSLFMEDSETIPDRFPWDVYYREGAEIVKNWNLPDAGNNPLFGLPDIPDKYELPKPSPFRYLNRYTKEDAKVFFGRSSFINALYTQVTDPNGKPLILLHGQSGAGKSSLLYSGLFPRIEETYQVVYIRRDQQLGLLGTLQKGLGVASRDLNLEQLRGMAHDFGEAFQEEFQRLISKLGEKHSNDVAPVAFTDEELEKFRQGSSLLPVWKKIEEKTGKPLIVILDQVEEMYTRPILEKNLDSPFASNEAHRTEFSIFLAALKKLFGNQRNLPQGKLLLAYRKEYHPEIAERLKQAEMPRSSLFLEHLKQQNVEEIILAFEQGESLRKAYNIQIEEGLAQTIAKDLTKNPDAPVAPVLQIILSRLWETAHARNPDVLEFTQADYNQIINRGIEMRDFFLQQMEQLASLPSQVAKMVDSGLALDLLWFHVTDMGTASSQKMEKIRAHYEEHQEQIEELTRVCQELSLLVPLDHHEEHIMLAHDTLAPIVDAEFRISDKPAQRAARILAAKLTDIHAIRLQEDEDWEEEEKVAGILLEEADLQMVDEGIAYIGSLEVHEKEEATALIERSHKERDRRLAEEKRRLADKKRSEKEKQQFKKIQRWLLAALGLAAIVFGIVQWLNVQTIHDEQRQRAKQNIQLARKAIHQLRYPEAYLFLKESAELRINEQELQQELNELAFVYLQVDSLGRVLECLTTAEPFVDKEFASSYSHNLRQANLLWAARDSSNQDSLLTVLLEQNRGIISHPDQDSLFYTKYYPSLVYVEGGRFRMGVSNQITAPAYQDAKPAHLVEVSDFYMGRYEVTTAQYHLFAMQATQYGMPMSATMPGDSTTHRDSQHPIHNVPHNMASTYCGWLGLKRQDRTYRLPTEAEWEFAAKGGKHAKGYRYAGSDAIDEVCWYRENAIYTSPVGMRAPNELGIYDLSGNVREWCADVYQNRYSPEFTINPIQSDEPEIVFHVLRGGAWFSIKTFSEVTMRDYKLEGKSDSGIGFRVVGDVSSP